MGKVAARMGVPQLGLPNFEAALAADAQCSRYWLGYIAALHQAGRSKEATEVLAMARQHGLEGSDVDALDDLISRASPASGPARKPGESGKRPKRPSEKAVNAMASRLSNGDLAGAEQLARAMARDYPRYWAGWKMLGVVMIQTGRYADARGFLEKAAGLVPGDAETHNNLGIACFELGWLDQSEASYRQALKLNPRYAQAHCNLGATLQGRGELQKAESCYRQALAIDPTYLKAINNLGSVLVDLKRFDEAEAVYRRALEFKSPDSEFHRNLGLVLSSTGRVAEAEADIRRAIELNPADPANFCSLAAIQKARGAPDAAEASLRRALELDPGSADALNDLGALLLEQRRLDEAEASLQCALGINSAMCAAWNNLGICLRKQERPAEAERAFRRSLEIRPDNAETLSNLGTVLQRLGRVDEAEAVIRRALRLDNDLGLAHMNLGVALKALDRMEEAEASFQRAAKFGVEAARVRGAMLLPAIMGPQAEVLASRARFETRLDELIADPPYFADPQECMGEPNFYLAYHGLNDRDLQVKVAKFYRMACPSLTYVAAHCLVPKPTGQQAIRIGVYSKFLFNHSVSTCYSRLITGMSRNEGFDVFLLTSGRIDESIYSGFVGEMMSVPDNLVRAREMIAELELDVMLFLDIGMEPTSYFLAFARLARTQCVFPGHPVTTGIDTLDFFISSTVFETSDAAAHYSERLVLLPEPPACFGLPEVASVLKTRSELGLPLDGHLYMCPMKLQKIHPEFDEAIGRILSLDSDGWIVLFDDHKHFHWKEMLRQRFKTTIPEALCDRIVFVPWISDYKDFVSAVVHADVLLDPFHFGIGSTVVVIGTTGTPQVTKPGGFLRGRVGAYYNDLLDITECTAHDTESYVQKAVEIACTPILRADLVRRILKNGYRLYEDPQPLQHLQEFIYSVSGSWRTGEFCKTIE
jgi:tetratricopeptide (TPR) repeat protein